MPDVHDVIRCRGCGKGADELREDGRVDKIRRGPGSARQLCGLCWVRERPVWHAGPPRS